MVAEDHPDGGIDDLCGDAVAILIGEAKVGIPSALVEVFELGAEDAQLLGVDGAVSLYLWSIRST
jgi:hypothetical protein